MKQSKAVLTLTPTGARTSLNDFSVVICAATHSAAISSQVGKLAVDCQATQYDITAEALHGWMSHPR